MRNWYEIAARARTQVEIARMTRHERQPDVTPEGPVRRSRQEIEARRKAFIRKWRLKHRAVADSVWLGAPAASRENFKNNPMQSSEGHMTA